VQLLVPLTTCALGFAAFTGMLPWWAAGVALLGVLYVVAFAALRGALPREVCLRAAEADAPADATAVCAALHELGFAPLGTRMHAPLRPPVVFLGFVQRSQHTFATVYEVGQPALRVHFDFVTVFEGGAMLTTVSSIEAGALPARPGAFMQILPAATKVQLLAAHRDGVSLLAVKGLRPMSTAATTPEQLHELVRASIAKQRAGFDAAPLRTTWIALWRTLTRRNPHLRPFAEQLAREPMSQSGVVAVP
jgi:hypothetical protein